MRTRALVMLVLALALVLARAAGAGTSSARTSSSALTVTFVGDSVPDAITYVPTARRRLGRGLVLHLDLRVCRRLVQRSCSFQGETPTTALQAVRSYGRALGKVLVVDVGYNEGPIGYGAGIDDVIRAALAQEATGVV